ncbi:PAS domain-containing protein [bacterium]|nr:PAS domain-containing protein [bacterium]
MDKISKGKNSIDEINELIVVGIGASAGGLEALQDFFKNMPTKTGLAFVVIQHLSPDYKSVMDELLARQTSIPISIAENGVNVEADHIYLIPPRKNISIFHNKLFLEEQNLKKGLNLPIDIFFRSLSADKGKNTIGVILSGTGSDGTLGTRAIKEAGGMVMVQDEQSAKFDGMPRSSIATGLVDYILPPSKMPEALINYIKHPFVKKSKSLDKILSDNTDTFTKIIIILRDFSGVDFSFYKENTIIRRLERRVSINRFENLEDYLVFLAESDKEKDILYRELLIGVTRFFRDSEAFDSLNKKVLPEITSKKTLRVWSVGCSTGEEVYSLAILIQEFLDKNHLNCEVKIFATDIDRHAINIAGQGYYPDSVAADIEPMFLTKYFTKKDTGYQINDIIRKNIVFATHNLLKDSPFSKLDLIVCRNLFIYFKGEIQSKILSNFYYSILPNGYLFMGSSESIGDMGDAFEPIDAKWKIYKYRSGYKAPIMRELLTPKTSNYYELERIGNQSRVMSGDYLKFEKFADKIVSSFLPPSVVLDSHDNILHTINDVSPFIKIQPGKFSQNILNNLPQELSIFVNSILRKMKKNPNERIISEKILNFKNLESKSLKIEGRVIDSDKYIFYVISFIVEKNEVTNNEEVVHNLDEKFLGKVTELEKELQFTKESLQATVEELETSNEELQSSNEELIASNEELQSTNEELQSVNEELYTVNSEYQVKIDELTKLNNDINNLMRNTEIGALYLDRNLCIRKITPLITKITNIMSSDIGRPITHLSVLNDNRNILDDVDKVINTLVAVDREIEIKNSFYFIRTRPYRTDYNAVEGILITFVDITNLKGESKRADIATERLLNALNIGKMAWWEWNVLTGKVIFDDRKATMLGYSVDEFPKDVYEICSLIHPDDYDKTMKAMKDYITGESNSWDITYRIRKKDGSYSWYYDRGSISEFDIDGKPTTLIGTVIDVSELKTLELKLNKNLNLFEKILQNSPIAQTLLDSEGNIIYANSYALELFNITQEDILKRSYNSQNWIITDLEGKTIPSENLPFSLLKNGEQRVKNYRHFITTPNREKRVLLIINGKSIYDSNGVFSGAVFGIVEDIYE